jgi:hypothetical protein
MLNEFFEDFVEPYDIGSDIVLLQDIILKRFRTNLIPFLILSIIQRNVHHIVPYKTAADEIL